MTPVFVDRDKELEILRAARIAALAGDARLVLVGGEAGIGKSELVRHLVAGASADGSVAWSSTPIAIGEPTPYAAVADLVRIVADAHPEVVAQMGASASELGAIAPSLRTTLAAAEPFDVAFARVRLLESMRSLFEGAARSKPPLTLVIDDLHWADPASLEVLSYLVRQLRGVPVLTVATYRSDETSRSPLLERLMIEMIRLDNVDHVRLGGLDAGELRAIAPSLSAGHCAAIARRTAGNPYFFKELAAQPASGTANGEELPDQLVDFINLRLGALTDEARAVAQVVALSGPLASGSLVAAVTKRELAVVSADLHALVRGGVLQAPSATRHEYAFVTPLVAEVAIARLLPDELSALHAAIARYLEANPSIGSFRATPVDIGLHMARAGDAVDAIPDLLRGADAAESIRAFEAAGLMLERAAQLSPRDADTSLRAAEMAFLTGRPEHAVALALQALRVRDGRVEDPHALERLAAYQLAGGQLSDALATFDLGLTAASNAGVAGEDSRGRLFASRGRALMLAGRYPEARADLEAAVREARRSGSRADESRALRTLASVLARAGDGRAATEALGEARLVDENRGTSMAAPRPSRIGDAIAGLLDRAQDLERAGSHEEAMAALGAASDAAGKMGAGQAWGGMAAGMAAKELFLLGRWKEADELLAAYDDEIAGASIDVIVTRARLRSARGEFDQAEQMLTEAISSLSAASPLQVANLFIAMGETALWRGHAEEAADAAQAAIAQLESAPDEMVVAEAVALGLGANASRAGAARARRSPAEIAAIVDQSLSLAAAGQVTPDAVRDEGRIAGLRGLSDAWLAGILGNQDAQRWGLAAARFASLREPYNTALARWREAEALLAMRGNRQGAEAAARDAYAFASNAGARPLADELEALARRARIELVPDAASTAASSTDELVRLRHELGLSEREIEVLALVAEGRTNRQIADELFITEKTAGHHVSNILTKLTVSTRVEAAAIAHRVGLLERMATPAI